MPRNSRSKRGRCPEFALPAPRHTPRRRRAVRLHRECGRCARAGCPAVRRASRASCGNSTRGRPAARVRSSPKKKRMRSHGTWSRRGWTASKAFIARGVEPPASATSATWTIAQRRLDDADESVGGRFGERRFVGQNLDRRVRARSPRYPWIERRRPCAGRFRKSRRSRRLRAPRARSTRRCRPPAAGRCANSRGVSPVDPDPHDRRVVLRRRAP